MTHSSTIMLKNKRSFLIFKSNIIHENKRAKVISKIRLKRTIYLHLDRWLGHQVWSMSNQTPYRLAPRQLGPTLDTAQGNSVRAATK